MTTPASAPSSPVPKTPFLLADSLVLLVVLLLVWTGSTPLGLIEKIGIVLCLCLGAVITAAPFIIDRKRRKEPAAPAPVASEIAPEPSPTSPIAAPAEPPAWVAEFKAVHARLDALEQSLARTATAAQADLRQLLDEHRTNETQSLTAARETLLRTLGEQLAATQQTTAAQADTMIISLRTAAAEQQEAARRAFDEATSTSRNEFATKANRLLARIDEQWTKSLSDWETRSDAVIRERVAAEIAEERAAAARRAVAAATLVLESSPAAAPSGKSRLGRGLESLISSPQAKPAAPTSTVAEPPEAPAASQLSLPEVEPPPAPAAVTPPPAPAAKKPEPAALDPFFIPANGYADLGSAMDAENKSASKRG